MSRETLRVVLLALVFFYSCSGYSGFDCGQGSALLVLASHRCPSDVHQRYLSCFRSLALRVKHCSIKAWPHPHTGRKQGCGSLQLVANVTDVNHAYGLLHLHGSPKQQPVPVHITYNRPDEAMHVRLGPAATANHGGCLLVFDAEAASDASLHPIPGEDTRNITALLAVLVPAMLVPCAIVGLVVALGGLARARGHAAWRKLGGAGADGYTLLDAGPSTGGQPLAEGTGSSGGGGNSRGTMGLGILKAMSRRARAKRMRRSCRPTYVGLPEQSAQQHRAYVSGRIQPGPFHLVAPFFKFPPVALPPPLEAIPESVTPTASSASRASSSQDLSAGLFDQLGSNSPVLDVDELALLQPDCQSSEFLSTSSSSGGSNSSSGGSPSAVVSLQQPPLDVLGGSAAVAGGTGWAWVAPAQAVGDAEEGGTAGS